MVKKAMQILEKLEYIFIETLKNKFTVIDAGNYGEFVIARKDTMDKLLKDT